MIWSDWLDSVADAMDVTTTQAGFMLAMIFTIAVISVTLIATRGKEAGVVLPGTALFCIILFTYMTWIPVWTGSVIGLIVALFLATKIAKVVG